MNAWSADVTLKIKNKKWLCTFIFAPFSAVSGSSGNFLTVCGWKSYLWHVVWFWLDTAGHCRAIVKIKGSVNVHYLCNAYCHNATENDGK